MDLEMWMASHDECGPDGCGSCATIDYTLEGPDDYLVRLAAWLQGKPVDVFLVEVLTDHARTLVTSPPR